MEDKNQTNTATGVSAGTANNVPPHNPESVSEEAVVTADSSVTTTSEAATVVTTTGTPDADMPSAAAVSTDTESSTSVPGDASHSRAAVIKQYAIAFAVVLVMAAGVTYVLVQQGRVQVPALFAKAIELVRPVPAAAVVNGVTISMADYTKNKSQIEQSATQGGADLTNETVVAQIKTQALDVLINTEILRQAATKEGVTVTDEQIRARYDEIVTSLQGEDKLTAKMAELGITKEGLMKDISSEILIQAYLVKAVDTSSITISQDDIKAAYDQANANPDAELPPLDQVSSAIEAQLKQTKEQELINAHIQQLRDAAKVETNV
jgi:FKBP-type peptidyl-prolyl cis-trans isomerase (trigger factor)